MTQHSARLVGTTSTSEAYVLALGLLPLWIQFASWLEPDHGNCMKTWAWNNNNNLTLANVTKQWISWSLLIDAFVISDLVWHCQTFLWRLVKQLCMFSCDMAAISITFGDTASLYHSCRISILESNTTRYYPNTPVYCYQTQKTLRKVNGLNIIRQC
jgi:hypothetical protein